MKGSTIAAMVLAAAAASAATIVALKKAHDKKMLREYEDGLDCDLTDEFCDCEEEDDAACCSCDEEDSEEEKASAADGCCADGVCSFGDDSADEPAKVKMPDSLELPETENAAAES